MDEMEYKKSFETMEPTKRGMEEPSPKKCKDLGRLVS